MSAIRFVLKWRASSLLIPTLSLDRDVRSTHSSHPQRRPGRPNHDHVQPPLIPRNREGARCRPHHIHRTTRRRALQPMSQFEDVRQRSRSARSRGGHVRIPPDRARRRRRRRRKSYRRRGGDGSSGGIARVRRRILRLRTLGDTRLVGTTVDVRVRSMAAARIGIPERRIERIHLGGG